jgi:predicted nucleic acid-binding protein
MMLKVVSNASPLIGLSPIKQLHLAKELWKEIIIPRAVFDEVVVAGKDKKGSVAIIEACDDWIKVFDVQNKKEVEALQAILDKGESEVIALGQELNADLLLLDNREPRLFARTVNLKVLGTVGIIKMAWQKGLIKDPMEKLHHLKINGFWLSNSLLEKIENEIK